VAPRDLDFRLTEEGKPYLRSGPSFNLSHSGHLVVLAFGHEGRVGVDVEQVRPLRDLGGLARASFAKDEIDALLALPGDEQIPAFFRIWTRKEAMLKALGCGLGGLESISVSLASNAGNMLRRLDRAGEIFANWTVESLRCLPEFEAAVAWDRPVREIISINL
jgi:4'-phosphopantetheinyl transferase